MWDEFEFDPRSPNHGSLRASDADRDVVHRALGSAYADGRLTRGEFELMKTFVAAGSRIDVQ